MINHLHAMTLWYVNRLYKFIYKMAPWYPIFNFD